jgi:protein-S-isoprenylcysteine O-methyltransferase Ste14
MTQGATGRPKKLLLGAWLFRHRGWVPVPLLVSAVFMSRGLGWLTVTGLTLVSIGWGVRIWAVAHIGAQSRTRGSEVEKLIYTGPYELSRNPIYVGNLVIYLGLGLMTEVSWMAGMLFFPMLVHYHFIILWEEWNLEKRLGEGFRSYLNRVPRWFGASAPVHAATHKVPVEERWADTFRSEQSTALAIFLVAGAVVLRGALS